MSFIIIKELLKENGNSDIKEAWSFSENSYHVENIPGKRIAVA